MSLRPALGWAIRTLLVVLALAPILPDALAGLPGLGLLDGWFAFHCERDPARSFAGAAVCVRCHGIYLGLALGALVARPRLRSPWHETWLALGGLFMVLDVLSETAGLRPAWWPLRLATGLVFAYPAGVLLIRVLGREPAVP